MILVSCLAASAPAPVFGAAGNEQLILNSEPTASTSNNKRKYKLIHKNSRNANYKANAVRLWFQNLISAATTIVSFQFYFRMALKTSKDKKNYRKRHRWSFPSL